MQKFARIFQRLRDPRAPNALHESLDILVIALAAVLCGAKGPTDMALFGRSKKQLLRQFLQLQHGIPSHYTFSRCCERWTRKPSSKPSGGSWRPSPKPTGSSLPASLPSMARRCAAPTSAAKAARRCIWSTSSRPKLDALASRKAPAATRPKERWSSAHALARRLYRHRRCAALQSPLCRDRAQAWRPLRAGAQAKSGQALRCRRTALCPRRQAQRRQTARTVHSRPPRIPAATVIRTPAWRLQPLSRVVALARITSRRRLHGKRADKPAVRYYLLSKYIAAKRLLQIVRSHWGIENRLHWVLDVVFDEDATEPEKTMLRKPRHLAQLHSTSFAPSRPHIHASKSQTAGWDDAFLLDLLSHMR